MLKINNYTLNFLNSPRKLKVKHILRIYEVLLATSDTN